MKSGWIEPKNEFSIEKSNNFIILFIEIDVIRVAASSHHMHRHDCDLFATYVAFWWLNEMFSKRLHVDFFLLGSHCHLNRSNHIIPEYKSCILATLFIKCKCIYVEIQFALRSWIIIDDLIYIWMQPPRIVLSHCWMPLAIWQYHQRQYHLHLHECMS